MKIRFRTLATLTIGLYVLGCSSSADDTAIADATSLADALPADDSSADTLASDAAQSNSEPPATVGAFEFDGDVTASVDAAGGTLESPSGASLVVPPGATASGTTVEIGLATSPTIPVAAPEGLSFAGSAVRVTPHGTAFDSPIVLTLPVSMQALAEGASLEVLRLDDEADTTFETLPGTLTAGGVAVAIDQFSVYVVAYSPSRDECYACSSRPDYFADRFQVCMKQPQQLNANMSNQEYCARWMGCVGTVSVGQPWDTVTIADKECKNPCTGTTCQNGGWCVSDSGAARCLCPTGFVGASCQTKAPDPCAGVTCKTPPKPVCKGASVASFGATGTCGNGVCVYPQTASPCPQACSPTKQGAACGCNPGFTGATCDRCLAGHGKAPNCSAPKCGDGILDSGEGCDDANTKAGDGCSEKCAIEASYVCANAPNLNTGSDNAGGLTAVGTADAVWSWSDTLNGAGKPVVASANCFPGGWLDAFAGAQWTNRAGCDGTKLLETDTYYTTTFSIPDATTAAQGTIAATIWVDNFVTDILINGVSTGMTNPGLIGSIGEGLSLATVAQSLWKVGTNTVTVIVHNSAAAPGDPDGLMVSAPRAFGGGSVCTKK